MKVLREKIENEIFRAIVRIQNRSPKADITVDELVGISALNIVSSSVEKIILILSDTPEEQQELKDRINEAW